MLLALWLYTQYTIVATTQWHRGNSMVIVTHSSHIYQGQIHTYICTYGVYTVLLAGIPPYIRSMLQFAVGFVITPRHKKNTTAEAEN